MLDKISVQGFKSIYDIQDLELGQVNVFIGANGSGKSNFLEAVGILSAAIDGRVNAKNILERGVRHGNPTLYRTSLKESETSSLIKFDVQTQEKNDLYLYKLHLSHPNKDVPDNWIHQTEKIFKYGNNFWVEVDDVLETSRRLLELLTKVEKPPYDDYTRGIVFTQINDSQSSLPPISNFHHILSNYMIFSPLTPILRGIQSDIYQRYPLGIYGGRLAEAINELLSFDEEMFGSMDLEDVLELIDWVDSFDITSPTRELLSPSVPTLQTIIRFRDYWMNQENNSLSGYDASEGALHILFLLVLALHPHTPRLFAVDNFDQALNPRLAQAFMERFCEIILASNPSKQILLTTHNPAVLNGLDLTDDRIRLFSVNRDAGTGGATQIRRIEVSEEIIEADEKGLSLSNLWMMGVLDGVPNI
ncbi:MAG: AAA family ATPase [Chloroflexota bacterium]